MKRSEQPLKETIPLLRDLFLDDLNKAMALAAIAHNGQCDLGKDNYVNHLMRVANKLNDDKGKTVAILHDVLEDTNVTMEMLEELDFDPEIMNAVGLMTRSVHQPYEEYVENLSHNELASRVKLSDLHDNLDVDNRRPLPPPQSLVDRYLKARTMLSKKYPKAECADTSIEWINP